MAGWAGKKLPEANLADAARHWARDARGTGSKGGRDELREALDAFGATDIPTPPEREPEAFEVYEENWPALQLFLDLQTQWRVGGLGGFLGLDYTAAEAVMRIQRTRDRPRLFAQLRAMERASLPILNERQSR